MLSSAPYIDTNTKIATAASRKVVETWDNGCWAWGLSPVNAARSFNHIYLFFSSFSSCQKNEETRETEKEEVAESQADIRRYLYFLLTIYNRQIFTLG